MKVIHISYKDAQEGAAIAVDRLCRALIAHGLSSSILVQKKVSDSPYSTSISDNTLKKFLSFVRIGADLCINNLLVTNRLTYHTLPFVGTDIARQKEIIEADIIHLHWINRGFLCLHSIEKLLSLNKIIIFTLHDSWAFTGGCHMPGQCTEYVAKCDNCSNVVSSKLSRYFLSRKVKIFSKPNFFVTAPSSWIAKKASKSAVFKDKVIYKIPNCVDTTVFKPLEKAACRQVFNLPSDRKIVLFNITNDVRKGIEFTRYVISQLVEMEPDLLFVGFGASNAEHTVFADLPVVAVGKIYDNYSMAALYNACDVMLAPALEEPFGQTYIEAMACGTPCVAFNCTGPRDIIDHKINGFLATELDKAELVEGIYCCLMNRVEFGLDAVDKVRKQFSFEHVARMFTELYEQLLKASK